MNHTLLKILSFFQLVILIIIYNMLGLILKKKKGCVIGVSEMASMIYLYGNLFSDSKTVCLDSNKFYKLDYDFAIPKGQGKFSHYIYGIKRVFYGPVLLAYLANKYDVFIYLWSTGFLLDREFDFRFLKKRNKKIITMFVGDDVRSPALLKKKLKTLEYDGFLDYVAIAHPQYLTVHYDEKKKKVAKVSDQYSDICFSWPIDQASYLTSKQYFLPYAYDKNDFYRNDDKFNDSTITKILHAPSNPLVKGTPLVRAAIKRLELEGYRFEYKELINVPNQQVLGELRSSHIVLNQFYAFAPGVFGIESLANHCAVLMSADPDIETGLPQDAKGAWMITAYWQVYTNLKLLLDNPEEIKKYADAGYEFALSHYTYEAASEYLLKIFKENGIKV